MLRQRLIVILALNNGVLYRTKRFQPDYRYTINYVDSALVDEVIILDITRPGQGDRGNFIRTVEEFSDRSVVPLTVGGGIRTLDDAKELLAYGADKVVVNTGAVERPGLISEKAGLMGSQAVVLAIDACVFSVVLGPPDGFEASAYEVFTDFGAKPRGMDPATWAERAVALGAGEILVTSIQRDGSLLGYDNELNRQVVDAVTVPVLCAGGVGNWQHLVDALNVGVSGVCVSNIFHMTETSLRAAKEHMRGAGCLVRM